MSDTTHHDDRHLTWDGCVNVRDLGGLLTDDGRVTRFGELTRADGLGQLTDGGWQDLLDHGVRTIIDLRNAHEVGDDITERPAELTTVNVAIDDWDDVAFWTSLRERKLDGTPLYFRPFLEAKPERCAAAIRAIAAAGPGGVVIHCMAGRDRTGVITTLVLLLAGVTADEIATDYDHSNERLAPLLEAMGRRREIELLREWLAHHQTTAREAVLAAIDNFDAEAYLLEAGVERSELDTIRARLVG